MSSRFAAFVIWAAVAASLMFWGARLLATPTPVPAHAKLVSTASAAKGDLARLFGSAAVAAAPQAAPSAVADPRFQLVGVVAPRAKVARDEGLAVIAFDGKPARAYRVGAPVSGELVLLSVHSRGAALGTAGQESQVSLELPLLPPPTTGRPGALDGAGQGQDFSTPAQGPGGQSPALRAPAPPPAPGSPPGVQRNPSARGQAPL